MTKILLHLGAILLVFSLNSQNLNMAEHEGIDKTGGIVSINSKFYYPKISKSYCCQHELSLTGTNELSQKIFKTLVGNKQVKDFSKVITTNDKAVVFCGFDQQSCDQTSSWEYITKLDTNGNVLFHTVVLTGSSWSPKIIGLTQHPDGSYYLIAYNMLYHCTASGQVATTFTLDASISSVTGLLALNNGNLLINATVGGVRKNVVLSTSGTILNSQTSSGGNIKFIEISNGFYTLRATGVVERYDSSLTLKAGSNISLATSSYTITDFALRNDSVYVTGVTGALKKPFYALLDSSFSVLHQTTLDFEGVRPTGIAVNNRNKVNIVSTCYSKTTTEYWFSGIFCLDITGSLTPSQDIGVINYSVVSSSLGPSDFPTPIIDLNVTVKNFGPDSVKSFFLNYYAFMPPCYILFHKRYDTTISPGTALSINTGSFNGQPKWSGDVKSRKWYICLFTTIPNGQNDNNINNDAYCDTLLVLPTGIYELIEDETKVAVYPNPFSNSFHLNSEKEIQNIEVYNSTGAIVLQEVVAGRDFEFGENWQSGVYFLKCHTNEGVLIRKLVKY
ncbi:MAG: T9SS type A sorting domain-containing protein [Bacteroidia bacterium]|nr:T9SS type A sorting domain-containing protein [Bacteroidia bacterium]